MMETNHPMFDPERIEEAPEALETPAVPELTRVNRVSGHEAADKLRHERRLKRLEGKGY